MKAITSILMLLGLLGLVCGQAYAATDRVGGSGTNVNVTIDNDTTDRTVLRSVSHTVVGGGLNDCMVVASANALTPFLASDLSERHYNFAICINNSQCTPPTGSIRTLSYVATPGVEDHNTMPISVNASFTGVAGANTFQLVGYKVNSASPNLVVDNSRIDFVCVDRD